MDLISSDLSKRRICSYDVRQVSDMSLEVNDGQGLLYFCGARCLAIWSLQTATSPIAERRAGLHRLAWKRSQGGAELTGSVADLVRWSVSLALDDTSQQLGSPDPQT